MTTENLNPGHSAEEGLVAAQNSGDDAGKGATTRSPPQSHRGGGNGGGNLATGTQMLGHQE